MSSVQPSNFSKKFTSSLSLPGVRFTGRELGRGADAVVVEAEHQGTFCAAKKLHRILLKDQSSGGAQRLVANFENEIATWYSLRHPHIVLLLGVHFKHGSHVPTLILEKMQSSLRKYVETYKKEDVPLPDKVFILCQVSQALAYLHSRQPSLVHHDLSPNNILLNQDSLLTKITDFGMSRVVDPSHSTRKSSVKGTLAFMSPEALGSPPKYTEKLDIFSFGNITLFTLTHLWPEPAPPVVFEGDKPVAVLELQRRQQYTRSLTAEERSSFFAMIRSCLENRPDRRPTSLQLVQQMRQMEEAHPRPAHSRESNTIAQLTQQLKEMGDQLKERDDQLQQMQDQMRRKDKESSREYALLLQENQRVQQERDVLQRQVNRFQSTAPTDRRSSPSPVKPLPTPQHRHMTPALPHSSSTPNYRDMEEVERECPICTDSYCMDEMVTMPHCSCSACKDCFKSQYTLVAEEKNIAEFNCLVCDKPDLTANNSDDVDTDDYLTLLAYLLKEHLDPEDYQLFQKKSTEFHLSKDDNFRWCAHEHNYRDMEEVERECPICTDSYCMDEMVTMPHCSCSACKDCFKSQYTLVAKEKNIAAFSCLICDKPDLAASDVDREDYLIHFANLLQEHLDPEGYQLFQKKSTQFYLSQDDNFRWCAHCGGGFIHDRPANRRIVCPHCKEDMCFYCKKPWEDQHRGVSCKDFTRWKAENDEGYQQKGLAAFLEENGFECPTCKFRYDLAKGGCLHFKCGQCSTEFCGGCGGVFGTTCRRFAACAKIGFHAHHPRDCLTYLRDWEVERLQKVLQDKDTAFDTEPPQKQVNAAVEKEPGEEEEEEKEEEEEQEVGAEDVGPLAVAGAENGLRCRVMLQKEVGSKKVDEECGEKCSPGHAGLCMKHYKEYLVCRINEASIDPAEFMEEGELRATLMRDEKPVPEKNAGESDGDFLKRLVEHLKRELELKKHEE